MTKALEAPCASTGKGCDVNSRVALIIGPEGGLSRHEVESFKALGDHVKVVTLGSLILRTETAGTVATALCMYGLGGLGAQYFGDDTE